MAQLAPRDGEVGSSRPAAPEGYHAAQNGFSSASRDAGVLRRSSSTTVAAPSALVPAASVVATTGSGFAAEAVVGLLGDAAAGSSALRVVFATARGFGVTASGAVRGKSAGRTMVGAAGCVSSEASRSAAGTGA